MWGEQFVVLFLEIARLLWRLFLLGLVAQDGGDGEFEYLFALLLLRIFQRRVSLDELLNAAFVHRPVELLEHLLTACGFGNLDTFNACIDLTVGLYQFG